MANAMFAFRAINILTIVCFIQYFAWTCQYEFAEKEPTIDGEEYIRRIVNGENIPVSKGILQFTAPFKLCAKKKCRHKNFNMMFPLYIGTKAREKYRTIYSRDYEKIHSTRPNAPFRKSPTEHVWTLPPNCSTVSSTPETTTPTDTGDTISTAHDVNGCKSPHMRPDCDVRVSEVDFRPTRAKRFHRMQKKYYGRR